LSGSPPKEILLTVLSCSASGRQAARHVTLAESAAQSAAPPLDTPGVTPITRTEQQSPTQVADRLITVFQSKTQEEWRKLIGFSKQWPELAPVVLDRCLCFQQTSTLGYHASFPFSNSLCCKDEDSTIWSLQPLLRIV
jgi:hypothetical protein